PDGSPTCRLGRTQRRPTSSRGPDSLRVRATALFTCLDRFHGLRRDAYLTLGSWSGAWPVSEAAHSCPESTLGLSPARMSNCHGRNRSLSSDRKSTRLNSSHVSI